MAVLSVLIRNPVSLFCNKSLRLTSFFAEMKKLIPSSSRSFHQSSSCFGQVCSPQPGLCDDILRIHLSGFPPSTRIQLRCSLVIPKDFIDCRSQAEFISDSSGSLDLSSSPSLGPSYEGVDPMGLFWSMDPRDGRELGEMSNVQDPLLYNVTVTGEEDQILQDFVVERRLINPGVRRIPVNSNGFVGTMFVPPGQGPFPAVLTVLGGKGIKEDHAGYLANHGFATFALAYWGLEGLPRSYKKIDIEFFEEAVEFLQKQEFVSGDNGVGLLGCSKGGDISLSMASFLPRNKVRAVVVVGGAITSMASTTSYKGLKIPAHGIKKDFDLSRLPLVRERTVRAFGCMDPLDTVPQSHIPFERSEADLLFIAGEDDMNWESQEFAEKAKEVCQDFGKDNIEIQTYPGMGHQLQTPFAPVSHFKPHAMMPKGVFVDMGGANKIQHATSQIKAWKNIVNFFKTHVKYEA